jgi:hypothetical protein
MIHGLTAFIGLLIVMLVLNDVFETIVLPRRVNRRWRLVRILLRVMWAPWHAIARRQRGPHRREEFLSYFGPLAVILLLAAWAAGLMVGFAVLLWAAGSPVKGAQDTTWFGTDLYVSGTTFFTLGLGDVAPTTGLARMILVSEVAVGFGVLALVISYLPILYQAFSRREVVVSLLDARAGSPPSAAELLRRHAATDLRADLDPLLRDWELWSAEVLESHLSYPLLAFFRSQHDNQSWLAALTTILDVSALLIAGLDGCPAGQAKLTFAMTRHTTVDLCQILQAPPQPPPERLTREQLAELRNILAAKGLHLGEGLQAEAKLKQLRDMYEPYVNGLAQRMLLELPCWLPQEGATDNWRTTAWEPRSGQRLF